MIVLNQCTKMCFASFQSGGFIAAIEVNPPERKHAKCVSVQWGKNVIITLERLDIFSLFCVIIRGILNIKVLLTIPKFGLFSSFFSLLAVSWGKVGCWLGSKLFFPFFELTNHQRCVPKCLLGMFYLRSRPCHPIFVKLSDLRFLYTH